jgi:hypothetical protein
MDIQVNKHQLERVVIKWLNMYYGNLTTKKHNNYRDRMVFYVNNNNEVMMEYSTDYRRIHIHNNIWSKIESLFHLNYRDIQLITKIWLEEDYKLKDVTPLKDLLLFLPTWEND